MNVQTHRYLSGYESYSFFMISECINSPPCFVRWKWLWNASLCAFPRRYARLESESSDKYGIPLACLWTRVWSRAFIWDSGQCYNSLWDFAPALATINSISLMDAALGKTYSLHWAWRRRPSINFQSPSNCQKNCFSKRWIQLRCQPGVR